MSTTSLKLSDDLRRRVAAAADGQGLSAHGFMVQAIETALRCAEERARFVAHAAAAREAARASGQGLEAEEVHAYLRARLAGKKPAAPKAKSWRG
jgi:predicted transcriptional regulator